MANSSSIRRLALVVGGGPAPGINGVISAVTIEAINRGIEVFGIRDGYKQLVKCDASQIQSLTRDDVKQWHNRGGSLLGTARTNPTKKPEDMANVLQVFRNMKFDALVSIGGDDTAYTASQVYKSFQETGGYIRVAHVPKTIDNDLPLPGSTPTFGFETARHYGVEIVGNLAEDARTTARWYIVISMGPALPGISRLGIGKASAATLSVIPEEFDLDADGKPNEIPLKRLVDIIIGSIIKRLENGKEYGVVVLAEGLIESVKADLKTILDNTNSKYGTYQTDEHGHLRLGQIEFGRLIRDLLTERLTKPQVVKNPAGASPKAERLHDVLGLPLEPYGLNVTLINKDLGYELRCADPIPFDAQYTRDLGYSAVKFLLSKDAETFGAVIGFIDGAMQPMEFDLMLDPKTKRMQTRLVNVKGEGYEVARRYMIRLDKRDFNNPETLAKLAAVVKKSPEQFRQEFEYLV